jgi:sugar phosphate isomerase/epimerase
MKLKLFKTLWGQGGRLDEALAVCRETGWAGVEGPAPADPAGQREFHAKLADAGLDYIAEICTGGSYVPDRQLSPARHLESLHRQAEAALACRPLFLTVIAGCDAWGVSQSVDFFAAADRRAVELGIAASFETHRSRSFFNPWQTRDILQQLPALKLTCDFSHWCVVCERLIDTEPEILKLCAARAHHVHARVGYDQGPQVPHPAAPQYQEALAAHERWWSQIWQSQQDRGYALTTLTPEFGPDGYLQSHPFTGVPVADLTEINAWMARRQRQRFDALAGAGRPLAPADVR